MAPLGMDPHRIVKRLRGAWFTDSRAETVTDIPAETRATDLADVATKADVAVLRTEIAALERRSSSGSCRSCWARPA
jgi:hypothetical protein